MRARSLLDALGAVRPASELARDASPRGEAPRAAARIVDTHRDLRSRPRPPNVETLCWPVSRAAGARRAGASAGAPRPDRVARMRRPRSRASRDRAAARAARGAAFLPDRPRRKPPRGSLQEAGWVTVLDERRHRQPPASSTAPGSATRSRSSSGCSRLATGAKRRPGMTLYRDLLASAVAALPDGVDRLVIVPDDVLQRLPFAALRATPDAEAARVPVRGHDRAFGHAVAALPAGGSRERAPDGSGARRPRPAGLGRGPSRALTRARRHRLVARFARARPAAARAPGRAAR